jgi:O-antigen/teichoic acid export membrane protein
MIVLNFLVKPVWIFFVDRQVQNLAGHETYGSYFSIFSLAIVLGFIADAGISSMMNRQIAMNQPGRLNQLFNYKVTLSVFYMIVLVVICAYSGIHNWKLVFLVGLIQVMNSFVIFFRAVITASQKFKTDSWISVLDKLMVIAFLLPFLYLFVRRGENLLYFFLYVQAASLLITLCIAGYIAGKSLEKDDKKKVGISDVFRLTLPFIILIGLMGVHSRLDMFLLERIHTNGAFEAGVYAASYRLLDAGNMLGYLSASFLLPYVARHLKKTEMFTPVVLQLRHGLLNIAIIAAAFCFFFAPWVIAVLYHTDSAYYQEVLKLCIIALPAYMMIHIYGSLLTAAGAFSTFTRIVLIAVIVNIGINILLIPQHGAIACVYAAIISQYLLALLCYFFAVRELRISAASKPFFLNAAMAILFSILFYYLSEKQVSMIWVLLIAGIVSALFMFVQNKLIRMNA